MIYWFVLAPIIIGLLAYIFPDRISRPLLIVFQLLFVLAVFGLFMEVKTSGEVLLNIGGWPDGFAITLLADEISTVLMLMTSVIYLFFLIYSYNQIYYESQFFFLYLVLQGLMMGLFLSSDLFNIFIFLEVSTVVVSILIMINKEKQAIYDGMIYFFVNVIGSSFLLFGIGFIYRIFGMLDMRVLKDMMPMLEDPSAVFIPYAFMMTTLSLKTAVIPLFSWLPKAHGTPSAPPVVSAVLSGLYIKSGVYLFIRFNDMYSPVIDMSEFFFVIGFLTAVVGFVMALGQRDIKLILAYHTVSQVGLIMMGINMGSEIAFWGGVYHILNHALFKSTLFLTAGQIYDEYGTRNVYEIRGVLKRMPWVGIATALAILGITGAPLFNGSISKYMIAHGTDNYAVTLMLNLVNLGTVMSFVKYATMLFGDSGKEGHAKTDRLSIFSSMFLGLASLLTGVFGVQVSQFLFSYELQVVTAEYIQKGIVYALMIIAGVGFYNGIIKHGGWLYRVGHIELTFNGIITAMAGYFIFLLSVLTFVF